MKTGELTDLAEHTEAECLFHLNTGAPVAIRAALGIDTARIGGGVALSMRNDPTRYWSKALGFGRTEPVSADVIARVADFYRGQDNPTAVLQIPPHHLPPDWEDIRSAHDLSGGSWWTKLARRAEVVEPGTTTLRVTALVPEHAVVAATTLLAGFGMIPGNSPRGHTAIVGLLAATATDERFRLFGAWDGADLVAVAWLYLDGAAAQFAGAATRPSHRRRGAQSALLRARVTAAAEAGCRWLFAETGRPAEGAVNQSLANLRNVGFTPLYDRRNWIWRPAGIL